MSTSKTFSAVDAFGTPPTVCRAPGDALRGLLGGQDGPARACERALGPRGPKIFDRRGRIPARHRLSSSTTNPVTPPGPN